ncbi:MAG TPA: GNAT family N-acetyltransferase [Gaiellaceae bacterium]|nr:GNAT family N-acetyltransferase [Gaiellaceae bacterium]
MPTSSALKELAEAPDRYTQLSADVERFADERVCILQGATWASVSDIRTNDVEALVADVQERVPAHKHAVWWFGPSSEPHNLDEQLKALGFGMPQDRAPVLHAMATETPPPESPGVDVRKVETFADYEIAMQVMWDSFETPEERRNAERPHMRASFEAQQKAGVPGTFIAYADGEPAGIGRSVYSPRGVFLIAGAVLPALRGRGVYRALVRARWDDAVTRGTPGLVTEAKPDTSYPILQRLGFEEVCVIRRLQDPR